MKLAVMIAHAAWHEERSATLSRLVASLPITPIVVSSRVKEHANVWARRLWARAAEEGADAVLLLNDDVVPHPALIEHVAALWELLPEEILSLHSQMPGTRVAADAGARLVRCYFPSGPAMCMTPAIARALLAWLETIPAGWFGGNVNEDGVIASFLWSRQTPAYASIPALVRHDTTTKSTLGYDDQPNRTSPVDWADFPVGTWTTADAENAPYVPVPWQSDGAFRELADALRGLTPICGFCGFGPAAVVHKERKQAGICRVCAREIARAIS